jgi:hypothetical protein
MFLPPPLEKKSADAHAYNRDIVITLKLFVVN